MAAGDVYEGRVYVFADRVGHPVDGNRISKDFRQIVNQAGLPPLTLHGLRHPHASLLPTQGTHVKVVSERLGHSSIGLTMDTYTHVLPSLQRKAAEDIDRALGRA